VLPDDAGVERNELMAELLEAGISTRRGIMAAHLEPAFAGHEHAPLPVTEHLTQRSIILPLFHQMTEADQDRVIAAFTSCLERASEESRVR
jgi:perosamine synthetase